MFIKPINDFLTVTFNCDDSGKKKKENKKEPLTLSTNHQANVPRPGDWDPIRAHDHSVTELQHYGDR